MIKKLAVLASLALTNCSAPPWYAYSGGGFNAPPLPPGQRYIESVTPEEKAATEAWQQRYIQEHGDPTAAEPLWMQMTRAPEDGSPYLVAPPDGHMEWISRSGTP